MRASTRHLFPRISYNNRHARHVEIDVSTRGDERIVPDRYLPNDNCIGSDPYSIFERGCARTRPPAGGSNRYALRNVDVRSENSPRADHNSSEVAYI